MAGPVPCALIAALLLLQSLGTTTATPHRQARATRRKSRCPKGSKLVVRDGVPLCVCTGRGTHWVGNRCRKTKLAHADYLDLQNDARAAVGSPSFVWNSSAATACQTFLTQLAKEGCLYEDPPTPYPWGNNLGAEEYYSTTFVVGQWVDEGHLYKRAVFPNGCQGGPKNISACGHYTQVVWKKSTSVGCASNVCNDITYVCCNYFPPGNFIGQYPF